jgi:hypothetical protein
MRTLRAVLIASTALAIVGAVGCSKKTTTAPVPSGATSSPDGTLAYQHTVGVDLDATKILERLAQTRAACEDARFGDCSVLAVETRSDGRPSGSITVRIVPAGVEPLTQMAAEGGRVESTQLRAEDLGDVVADTARQTQMLRTQRQTLQDYQGRSGLTAADLIALSGELSGLDTRLDALDRAAADQQRRIRTNLLTLYLSDRGAHSGFGRIGTTVAGFTDSVVEGTTEALEMLGYGLPFAILAFPLALLWRALWRRATRRRDRPA